MGAVVDAAGEKQAAVRGPLGAPSSGGTAITEASNPARQGCVRLALC